LLIDQKTFKDLLEEKEKFGCQINKRFEIQVFFLFKYYFLSKIRSWGGPPPPQQPGF